MTQPQPCDLIIHSASQMLTLRGGPQRGSSLGTLHIIEDGGIAIKDGMIIAVGHSSEIQRSFQAKEAIDAKGRVLLPGFVDPHTHLIWAGDRAGEFELRIRGASYMEIMAAGGGSRLPSRQPGLRILMSLSNSVERVRKPCLHMAPQPQKLRAGMASISPPNSACSKPSRISTTTVR